MEQKSQLLLIHPAAVRRDVSRKNNHPHVNVKLSTVRVVTFVGPAGTGKSLRAQLVARWNDVDFIIDDGLLIADGRILAGRSAKAEKNLVRAIRRALFQYDDHRESVIDVLSKECPCKVMIIATSLSMAEKIITALGLPSPEKTIDITEVATKEEIRSALWQRHEKGQHIIPVIRAQVRRNFAGKLVGHIRDFLKHPGKEEGERTIVCPPFSFYGALSIAPTAVADIVDHVSRRSVQAKEIREIRILPTGDSIHIEIHMDFFLGRFNLLAAGRSLRRRVIFAVRYFAGMDVSSVDVHIQGVDPDGCSAFPIRPERRRHIAQD